MGALPETLDAVTAKWLEGALSARFAGVRVAGVGSSDLGLGTNANATLAIRYERGAGPASVFLKLPPVDPARRALVARTGMGEREARFYASAAPDVPMRVPEVYFAACEPESGAFLLLLEDLASVGATFPTAAEGVPLDAAEGAIDDLAALHGRFAEPGRAPVALPWLGPPTRLAEYGAGMLEHALAARRDELEGDFAEVASLYVAHHDAIHDAWDRGPSSVIHGDAHLANLFLEDGRVGFFDWGLVARAPMLRDVGYFLCMALSVENRRRNERALLARYLERLREAGGPAIGLDEAFEAHRLHAAYTVPAAAPAAVYRGGRIPGQAEYSRDFVARASAAVADLEAASALRAAIGL